MNTAHDKLIAAARQALEALGRVIGWDDAGMAMTEDHIAQCRAADAALRSALAAPAAPSPALPPSWEDTMADRLEPVAFLVTWPDDRVRSKGSLLSFTKPADLPGNTTHNLHTAAQLAAEVAKARAEERERMADALTDERAGAEARMRAAGMGALLAEIRASSAARDMDDDLLDRIDMAIADQDRNTWWNSPASAPTSRRSTRCARAPTPVWPSSPTTWSSSWPTL